MSIFKECDIRGIFESELNIADAKNIGRAIGTMISQKEILVSGDVRLSTHYLKDALIEGLMSAGASVFDMGINPTPAVYFAKKFFNKYACVQVTASHNPAKYNGFKVAFGENPILPSDISAIEKIINDNSYISATGSYFKLYETRQEYIKSLEEAFGNINLKVVVDSGNGCVSKIMPQIFKNKNADVVELFCTEDGSFPNREPNPAVYSNLNEVCKCVKQTHADFACAFDGDGDRVVFVDECGEIVNSEQALVIFINEYLSSGEPSSVVYDLKSSSIVKNATLKHNGKPIMERSGHAFIKKTFLENSSVLAGEISGHFFFGELGYDDGLYAALKMGEIIAKNKKTLSELRLEAGQTIITPDIRIPFDYNEREILMEQVLNYAKKYTYSLKDGVRIEYPYGWLLLRKSVTEAGITLRIEADTIYNLEHIKQDLKQNVKMLNDKEI